MVRSQASRGHTISFKQDIFDFAHVLPRIPEELPVIVLKSPNETITDISFLVRGDKLIAALQFLKENNENYRHIQISTQNTSMYVEIGIVQFALQIDSSAHNIPQEEASAVNEESTGEPSYTVDLPIPQENLLTMLRAALQIENQQANVEWPTGDQRPISEFTTGYFSKAFPDFFPDGKRDYTKSRLQANSTLADYFRHLMRLDRAHGFVTHHSFTFVCTNMLRRHAALNTGNVFAKRCAQDLSVAELKRAFLEWDEKVLNKLLYFAAPISAPRQNLRYKTHQAVSFTQWLRLSSDDMAMFNYFQTFSAPDIHWDDLHKLLPGFERYILKAIVKDMEDTGENCILESDNFRLRSKAVKDNADIFDCYFYH